MNTTKQYCTFYVRDLFFGIDVMRVQEVLRFQNMTRVPLAAPFIRGLINLRGQIVTAVEMRLQLGLEPRPVDQLPMNVVVKTSDGVVSLLVDEIGDVLEINQDGYEPRPATLVGPLRQVVSGVYKLEHQLLLVLETTAVLGMVGSTSAAA